MLGRAKSTRYQPLQLRRPDWAKSEELAKEAFTRMEVHLDLNMAMIRPLDGLQQAENLKEFGDIYKRLEKRLEPLPVNQEQWKRDKSYLWHEDRIVVPREQIPALLKWTHAVMSGQTEP